MLVKALILYLHFKLYMVKYVKWRKGDSNLKATGIVRKIDPVGRLTLPKELRRQYQLKKGDAVEIFTDNKMIILQKINYSQSNI